MDEKNVTCEKHDAAIQDLRGGVKILETEMRLLDPAGQIAFKGVATRVLDSLSKDLGSVEGNLEKFKADYAEDMRVLRDQVTTLKVKAVLFGTGGGIVVALLIQIFLMLFGKRI